MDEGLFKIKPDKSGKIVLNPNKYGIDEMVIYVDNNLYPGAVTTAYPTKGTNVFEYDYSSSSWVQKSS